MAVIIMLLTIGTVLIAFNLKAIKKEKHSFSSILTEKSSEITDVEVIIGELRREFSETILELQKEIIELREKVELLEENKSASAVHEESALTVSLEEKDFVQIEDNAKASVKNRRNKKNERNSKKDCTDDMKTPEDSQKNVVVTEDKSESSNSIKIKEVGAMLDNGTSLEEICDKLKIGKGEVLLIKELYLR